MSSLGFSIIHDKEILKIRGSTRILYKIRFLNKVLNNLHSVFSNGEFLIPEIDEKLSVNFPANAGFLLTKSIYETNFIFDVYIHYIIENIMEFHPYLEYILIEIPSSNNDKYLEKLQKQ